MRTAEFSKATKRDALKRASGACEAVGEWYGLDPNERCGAPLSRGVQFDHIILEANSHDNSLENCAAVCIPCHGIKTAKHDIPKAAKTVRQRDKNDGIRARSIMPGSKNSPWRKRMDGTVERRS